MSEEHFSPTRLVSHLRQQKIFWLILAVLLIGLYLVIEGRTGSLNGKTKNTISPESSLEERLKAICEEVSGVSDVNVMLTYTSDERPRVLGVALVCMGGDNPQIKLKLNDLVCALFGITSESVSIIGSG